MSQSKRLLSLYEQLRHQAAEAVQKRNAATFRPRCLAIAMHLEHALELWGYGDKPTQDGTETEQESLERFWRKALGLAYPEGRAFYESTKTVKPVADRAISAHAIFVAVATKVKMIVHREQAFELCRAFEMAAINESLRLSRRPPDNETPERQTRWKAEGNVIRLFQ